MKWVPLHCHSDNSLLDGLSKPSQITNRCVELGYNSCALTDHGTISGAISFLKACGSTCVCGHSKAVHGNGKRCYQTGCTCETYNKFPIKAILGNEFYLCETDASIKDKSNRRLSHLVVLAKNLQGWKNLIAATSEANKKENVYYGKPRLNLEKLAGFARGDFITFSGHMGSDLANVMFVDIKLAYASKTVEQAKGFLKENYYKLTCELARKYQDLFGKDNFSLEIQLIDKVNLPASEIVAEVLRRVGHELKIPLTATADSHYPRREDAADQRILLCSAMKTTLNNVQRKLNEQEEVGLGAFFKGGGNYHIPSLSEMQALHTEEELANTEAIASICEAYDIFNKPAVPEFICPDEADSEKYLRELCVAGWKAKIANEIPKDKYKEYGDRVKYELSVINGYPLLRNYFLIVQDYMQWARARMLCGAGRGSAAGCMVSHLLNITDIDPIKYDLLFERFYNSGRNTPDRVSLPDIDCDFPTSRRNEVKTYIKNKYGEARVCEMTTFGRMQGRGALKDVLRAHEYCSFEDMNKITAALPESESDISDELQIMKEETGEVSIIKWALENTPKELAQWCSINEQGNLVGDAAPLFAQAIRLEGTKRSQSKHASGIVIATKILAELCPMIYDKGTENYICGFDMNDMEAIGLPKFDVLGLSFLDRAAGVESLIRTGEI